MAEQTLEGLDCLSSDWAGHDLSVGREQGEFGSAPAWGLQCRLASAVFLALVSPTASHIAPHSRGIAGRHPHSVRCVSAWARAERAGVAAQLFEATSIKRSEIAGRAARGPTAPPPPAPPTEPYRRS